MDEILNYIKNMPPMLPIKVGFLDGYPFGPKYFGFNNEIINHQRILNEMYAKKRNEYIISKKVTKEQYFELSGDEWADTYWRKIAKKYLEGK